MANNNMASLEFIPFVDTIATCHALPVVVVKAPLCGNVSVPYVSTSRPIH